MGLVTWNRYERPRIGIAGKVTHKNAPGARFRWRPAQRCSGTHRQNRVWRECYKLSCRRSKVVQVTAGDITKLETEIPPLEPSFVIVWGL
jgi:hypothetical protein